MSEPMVKSEGVHKRFGQLEVLKGISLEVQRGEDPFAVTTQMRTLWQ